MLTISLRQDLPKIDQSNYTPTSPATPLYNCIAWAAGEQNRWWEPDGNYQYYWPAGVPREYTVDAYIAAYETLGYVKCDDGMLEKKYEKVAIYFNLGRGMPTHAARQLRGGEWTSKLGKNIDISHVDPDTLTGGSYGTVVQYMKRKWPK